MNSALLTKLQKLARLFLEQPSLNGRRTTQSPQQACESEHQFSFDRRLRIVVRSHRHFESRIIVGVFKSIDHGFSRQPMTKRVAA